MNGTIDGFAYGWITPVAAYLMACLGSALGLRCIVRTVHHEPGWRPGWLLLGATSLGCGIWTMHFIGMSGFTVAEAPITFDVPLTVLSLAVAIVVVSAGVFIVGYRGAGSVNLAVAGSITGLGVAAMHYLGMAAMHLDGDLRYNPVTVGLSVVIALFAATAALWAAVSVRGFALSLGASLVMGLAVSGMHYVGMAAVSVHLHGGESDGGEGHSAVSILLPMLVGPVIFLLLAGVIVMFDPVLILGQDTWKEAERKPVGRSRPAASAPAPAASDGFATHHQDYFRPQQHQAPSQGQPLDPSQQRTQW